jgi:hypothetical protein
MPRIAYTDVKIMPVDALFTFDDRTVLYSLMRQLTDNRDFGCGIRGNHSNDST